MKCTDTQNPDSFSLLSLVLPFYVPSALAFLGSGLAVPLLAIYARRLGMADAGIGNGFGTGINMTLSTDFAPRDNPSEFIGMWRFVVDLGTMSGPFIVGLITGILSLSGAALLVAAVGVGGAVVMGLLVPETKPRSKG